jgi:hypothetical protein
VLEEMSSKMFSKMSPGSVPRKKTDTGKVLGPRDIVSLGTLRGGVRNKTLV